MKYGMTRFKKLAVGASVATLLAAVSIVPALGAESGTSVTVSGGALTVTHLVDPLFEGVAYSHTTARTSLASTPMSIQIDDSRGTGEGWSVSIVATDLTGAGGTIAAGNVSIVGAVAPTFVAGQAIDEAAATGPFVGPAVNSAIDTVRVVAAAGANYGQGTYNQGLPMQINVPALTKAGAYTGTLTTSTSAAP